MNIEMRMVLTKGAAEEFNDRMLHPDREALRLRDEFIAGVEISEDENDVLTIDCSDLELDMSMFENESDDYEQCMVVREQYLDESNTFYSASLKGNEYYHQDDYSDNKTIDLEYAA